MTTEARPLTPAETDPDVVARTPTVGESHVTAAAATATEASPTLRRWLEHERARWLLVALVALVAAGLWWWHVLSGRERTDDAFVEGPIVAIASQVGGQVTSVLVEENQQVEAGDLLVQIDPREHMLVVQRAEADLAAAEAHVAAARAQVPIAETSASAGNASAQAAVARARASEAAAEQAVAAAQARLEQAEAAAEQAEQDLERMRTLVAKDEVPRASFDHAMAAAKSARAAVTETHRGIELAESRRTEAQAAIGVAQAALEEAGSGPRHVEAARAQLEVASAQLAQAQARLGLARKDLEDTEIHAPSDGTIGMKSVNPGETVRAGQPLLALVRLEDVWITANFKETQLERMRPGQQVKVHVDAYGRDFQGRVKSIGAAAGSKFSLLPAQNATGNFVKVVQRVPVRIVLDEGQDPEQLLRPGMSVVPTVILE